MAQVLASSSSSSSSFSPGSPPPANEQDQTIQAFRLPDGWFAQEPRFVPASSSSSEDEEDNGYLLFYAFNEHVHLDPVTGSCPPDSDPLRRAKSELWILNARDMKTVVARVYLPQRVPYGLHGSWFGAEMVRGQRGLEGVRRGGDRDEGDGEGDGDPTNTPTPAIRLHTRPIRPLALRRRDMHFRKSRRDVRRGSSEELTLLDSIEHARSSSSSSGSDARRRREDHRDSVVAARRHGSRRDDWAPAVAMLRGGVRPGTLGPRPGYVDNVVIVGPVRSCLASSGGWMWRKPGRCDEDPLA
ncbi:hypothetical protein KC333_g109 [Hortaea werneckii]|nr:hypothetical protein KC333_g109 [Hortaea werneckii]